MIDANQISPSRLRSELRRQGLRQADIATAIGCDQGHVSRLLSGSSPTRSRTYRRICELLLPDDTAERDAGEQIIRDALNDCWDGSPDEAREIAAILRALGAIGRHRKRAR
ncbi:MAG: helix-turn-helix transcriptional regulator [Salinisphaera sp.]|nr:helix-turn-helix transcriptional regulator [Salinisphaera sp.]